MTQKITRRHSGTLARWFQTWLLFGVAHVALGATKGELQLVVVDHETRQSIPARLRITNSIGRVPRINNVIRQGNDITFQGPLTLKLPLGRYTFSLDRGPHYRQRTGQLKAERDGFDQQIWSLPRFADLKKEGWYGGDLLVARPFDDLPLLMAAEELDLAVHPTWTAGETQTRSQAKLPRTTHPVGDALADLSAGQCAAESGNLLLAKVPAALVPETLPTDPYEVAKSLRRQDVGHVALLDPFAWDLPMLVAHGLVDSIAVLHPLLRLDGDARKISQGRPPASEWAELPGGIGRYSQEVYFDLLNCGLRIPPSAASGSGDCDNPPGYNRVYVYCGQDFSAETWWRNLEQGRVIVSNGPLLRVRVNGELPGYVFQAGAGGKVELDVACQLSTRQSVEYLEIIKNGKVSESVRLDDWAAKGGHLPLVEFQESGWAIIRAVASSEGGFRAAMTGPFYVEIGANNRRISRQSAQLMLDWVYDRARQIRKLDLTADELRERLAPHRQARDFWQQLVDQASAD